MITLMLSKIVATVSIASLCLLSYMLVFTAPAEAGPFGLLTVFVSAYLTFVGLISFFLLGVNRLVVALSANMALRKPLQKVAFRRCYYLATVLATAPVMLIGLQSVQAIGLYDLALVVLFQVVACVYILRRTS